MVNPNEPFIAEDGYEYEDLAAFLLQRPTDCWRNLYLKAQKLNGLTDAELKAWSKAYGDEIEGDKDAPGAKGRRHGHAVRAYNAIAAFNF